MSELQGALSDRGWDPRDADRRGEARVRNALGGALVVARVFGWGGGLRIPDVRRYLVVGERVSLVRIAGRRREDHAEHPPLHVDERTTRVAGMDVGLEDEDLAGHEILVVDVAALRLDRAVHHSGHHFLAQPARITHERPPPPTLPPAERKPRPRD